MLDMKRITEAVLGDYEQGRDIDRLALHGCPDPAAVRELTDSLGRIIFPARAAGQELPKLIEKTAGRLALMLGDGGDDLCAAFFARIPAVRALVQGDLQAAFDGDPAASGTDEILLAYPGLFAVTVYRLAHELYALGVPVIPRMMTEYAHSVTGIDIHPGAVIGERFFIDHGTGVVIGQTTVIGADVKLYQGVTLGGLSTRGGQSLRNVKRHPTIEDNVTIYANASVLGGGTLVGWGSVIGAGTFVTKSVPPCTTVTIKSQELTLRPSSCAECKKIPPL